MKEQLKIFIWIFFSVFYNQSIVANSISKDSIITVKYGIYLKKINPDFKEGKFNAEFYWWAIFKNDKTKTGITNEEILNLEYVKSVREEFRFCGINLRHNSINPNLIHFNSINLN